MPIYRQTYKHFDGPMRAGRRWWPVARHELKLLSKSRPFMILALVGSIQVLLRVLQIVAVATLAANKNNQATVLIRQIMELKVSSSMFFDFLRLQSPLVVITTIFAGSGMICNDLRHNLMDVYFSKAITWRDYVAGKLMTLVIIGLMFTCVPALFLLGLHNLLSPGMETLRASYWLPAPIIGFSLLIVLPTSLGVLASSTMFSSERYASVSVFVVLMANITVATSISESNNAFQVLAFPMAINRLGELLFSVRRPSEVSWPWAAVFFVAVCLAAFYAVCRKVKHAEVAS